MLHEQELCYKWEMLVMAINCSKYQSQYDSFNTICPFQKNLFIVYNCR